MKQIIFYPVKQKHVILFLFFFFPLITNAQSIRNPNLSLPQIIYDADAIIRGNVLSKSASWGNDRMIFTEYEITITDTIYNGNKSTFLDGEKFILNMAGGRVDTLEINVGHLPGFSVGEDLVLFLFEKDRHTMSPLVGTYQGFIRIEEINGRKIPFNYRRQEVKYLFEEQHVSDANDLIELIRLQVDAIKKNPDHDWRQDRSLDPDNAGSFMHDGQLIEQALGKPANTPQHQSSPLATLTKNPRFQAEKVYDLQPESPYLLSNEGEYEIHALPGSDFGSRYVFHLDPPDKPIVWNIPPMYYNGDNSFGMHYEYSLARWNRYSDGVHEMYVDAENSVGPNGRFDFGALSSSGVEEIYGFTPTVNWIGYCISYTHWSPWSNKIVESDIILNNEESWTTDFNLAYNNANIYHAPSTMAHEIGHAFGLAHPWDDDGSFDQHANSVMTYSSDNAIRTERYRPYMMDARAIRSAYGSTAIDDFGVYLHYTVPGKHNVFWSEFPPDVQAGESFTLHNIVAENLGTLADERTLNFYLTTQRHSWAGATYYNIGTLDLWELDKDEYIVFNQVLTVPEYIADGDYFLAVDIGSDEYNANRYSWSKNSITVHGDQRIWAGTQSSDWHDPANWHTPAVPDQSINVLIPSNTPFQPEINANAECRTLQIESGATLTHNNGWLDIYGSFNTSAGGSYIMTSYNAFLFFRGENDAAWANQNQNDVYKNVEIFKTTTTASVKIFDDISCSGIFHILNGKLKILITKTLTVTNNGSEAFWVHGGGTLALSHGRTLVVAGNIVFDFDSHAEISGGTILCGRNFRVEFTTEYIKLNNATLIMNGTGNQYIQDYSFGNLQLHNLTINKSDGTVYLAHANLNINGNLFIQNGRLSSWAGPTSEIYFDIYIKGDWTNNNVPMGFMPAFGRVVFNGTGDQYIWSDEEFNILEAGLEGNLHILNNHVVCNQYDWLSGGIEVHSGSFSALDLMQNGIHGSFRVHQGGTIDLVNSQITTWVDLHGSLYNYGGTINISGSFCYWPFADGAHVEMTDGIIDIKTSALTIFDLYSWTHNITGGTIRIAHGYFGDRPDFNPLAGTFEFYGPENIEISQLTGSTLPNVVFNKIGKSSTADERVSPRYDERTGSLLSDGGRSGQINLASDLHITGDLTIQSGTVNIKHRVLAVDKNLDVYGSLKMTDNEGILHVGKSQYDNLHFFEGSNGHFTHGDIFLESWLVIENGALFSAETGNTIHLTGNKPGGGLANSDPSTMFGNIEINKTDQAAFLANDYTGPYVIKGNLTLHPDNSLRLHHGSNVLLHVKGTFTDSPTSSLYFYTVPDDNKNSAPGFDTESKEVNTKSVTRSPDLIIDNDLILSGKIDLFSGDVLVNGQFESLETSSIIISGGGSIICDGPFDGGKGWQFIRGDLTMNHIWAMIEATNTGFHFVETASVNISDGTIRTNNFIAEAGVFQPTGGLVEIIDNTPIANICKHWGNHFHNFKVSRNSNQSCTLKDYNVVVMNNLTIDSGQLIQQVNNLSVGGNWVNNVGVDGFEVGIGKVSFNGNADQEILGNNLFYDLENAKESGLLLFNDHTVVENAFVANGEQVVSGASLEINGVLNLTEGQLDLNTSGVATAANFNMGGSLNVSGGSFSCNDIINDGIFGSIYLDGGEILLTQTDPKHTDLNCNLEIHEGNMTIHGTYNESSWGYDAPASLTMTGGVLDFTTPGVFIGAGYPVSTEISGGTIRTSGNFRVSNPGFMPSGGIVELSGTEPVFIKTTNNAHVFDLIINKNGNTFRETEKDNPKTGGLAITSGILKVKNNTMIESGTLQIQEDATNVGNMLVGSGARLMITGMGNLSLGAGKSLTVSDSGMLEVIGNEELQPKLSRIADGHYSIDVESGGIIAASYAIFEYMNSQGVNIKPGALVDPVRSFDFCTFRNGQAGGRLLTINNSEVFDVQHATFPTNTWGGQYNVYKDVNTGHVTFNGHSGGFSGSSFEYDPYNRISWEEEPLLTAEPLIRNVTGDAGITAFEILSNLDWHISENNDWLTVEPESGSHDKTISVTYEANQAAEERIGIIIVDAEGVPELTLQLVQSGIGIPLVKVLSDQQFGYGDLDCFDALKTITTENFVVESGGAVQLIAGETIHMLPGTHAHEGSYFHAGIAPYGPFCGEPEKHFLAENKAVDFDERSDEITHITNIKTEENELFRLFPNPTMGEFTLELYNYEQGAVACVEVYNMHGELVKRRMLLKNKMVIFNLTGQLPGIYLIRVMQSDKMGVERLIKR